MEPGVGTERLRAPAEWLAGQSRLRCTRWVMLRAGLRVLPLLSALALLGCGDSVPSMMGETSSSGDGDGDGDGDATGDGDGEMSQPLRPNWHEDIAPLVYENCVGCHFDGGIGPFSLETYESAAAWGTISNEAIHARVMPPWGAEETDECQPPAPYKNDARLTDEERQLFDDWVNNNTPEGDPANAAALPEPPSLDLEGVSVERQNPTPFTVTGTEDSFPCMVVDPGHTEDVWVTGIQMIPDNDQVVHHVLTYIDPTGASDAVVDEDGKFDCPGGFANLDGVIQMSTWTPGNVPTELPPNSGFPMPVGSKVIMAYHYHPTGQGDEVDQSSIALRWTNEKPELNAYVGVSGAIFDTPSTLLPGPNDPGDEPLFEIPPNVPDHVETVRIEMDEGIPPIAIFSEGAHMHYVGVDMKIWIERGDEEICLLHVPAYDFGWQRNYDFDVPVDEMPTVQGGDVVYYRCTYDNTLGNPALAKLLDEQGLSEPVTIGVGEQSLEEMCANLFGLVSPLPLDQLF